MHLVHFILKSNEIWEKLQVSYRLTEWELDPCLASSSDFSFPDVPEWSGIQ